MVLSSGAALGTETDSREFAGAGEEETEPQPELLEFALAEFAELDAFAELAEFIFD